jgi:hypothetical protein
MLPSAVPIHTYYQQLHTSKIAMATSSSSRPHASEGVSSSASTNIPLKQNRSGPSAEEFFEAYCDFFAKQEISTIPITKK